RLRIESPRFREPTCGLLHSAELREALRESVRDGAGRRDAVRRFEIPREAVGVAARVADQAAIAHRTEGLRMLLDHTIERGFAFGVALHLAQHHAEVDAALCLRRIERERRGVRAARLLEFALRLEE